MLNLNLQFFGGRGGKSSSGGNGGGGNAAYAQNLMSATTDQLNSMYRELGQQVRTAKTSKERTNLIDRGNLIQKELDRRSIPGWRNLTNEESSRRTASRKRARQARGY